MLGPRLQRKHKSMCGPKLCTCSDRHQAHIRLTIQIPTQWLDETNNLGDKLFLCQANLFSISACFKPKCFQLHIPWISDFQTKKLSTWQCMCVCIQQPPKYCVHFLWHMFPANHAQCIYNRFVSKSSCFSSVFKLWSHAAAKNAIALVLSLLNGVLPIYNVIWFPPQIHHTLAWLHLMHTSILGSSPALEAVLVGSCWSPFGLAFLSRMGALFSESLHIFASSVPFLFFADLQPMACFESDHVPECLDELNLCTTPSSLTFLAELVLSRAIQSNCRSYIILLLGSVSASTEAARAIS
jgi:hypothetical protein